MEGPNKENILCLPHDPRIASKTLLDKILSDIQPLVLKIRNRSHAWSTEDSTSNICNVYTLCLSQIQKCVLNLFEVFKYEFSSQLLLQETRQCNLERLSWCVNRLVAINNYLEKPDLDNSTQENDSCNESFNVTVMYFVNWIDHAFEMLTKLSETVYKTDYKENNQLYEQWKCELEEIVSGLHLSIDELLLSAMTIYRYCLPSDQLIVKTRCQVVLRETKALLGELIEGDLDTAITSTSALKLPVMPTNINVMIDVLKDVLYVLETNANNALLGLLIQCFGYNKSPVDVLKQHFLEGKKGRCNCMVNSTDEVTEDCQFVKDFDLYNERLLQLGTFAVSCSSDQDKTLTLRSGLASLEALDPHLVPALMTSPNSHHSSLLVKCWRQEVAEIRDFLYLIAEPAAFASKSKQMLHQKLLELLKETTYNNTDVTAVINIGCVVQDLFNAYVEKEPFALSQMEKLRPMLADLRKVIQECKVVSNLLCSDTDFFYDVATPTHKEVTLDQLYKRLKVIHTLITRINTLFQPKDQYFDDEVQIQNVTHTILKQDQTYLKSPKKPNLTRSIFARTNIRSSTRNFPLAKLTKHLHTKNCSQLNFSVELDRLFNLSNERVSENSERGTFVTNKVLDRVRERSVLYNFSPIKNRSSMRKIVLNRQLNAVEMGNDVLEIQNDVQRQSLLDETGSLQLTELLNQINDTTTMLTSNNRGQSFNQTSTKPFDTTKNIVKIPVNRTIDSPKNVWNIPVRFTDNQNDTILTSSMSNVTQPSNVTTMERINDLEMVETKLNSLKSQFETSL